MSFLFDFGVIAAFLLLFLPPLFTWAFNFHIGILKVLTVIAPGAALLMIYMMNEAYYVFIIYLGVFYFVLYIARIRRGIPYPLAFALAVYVPFSISVLWEFPIQLVIPQNIDALILSTLKALGIVFFFQSMYRLGWKPNREYVKSLITVLAIGSVLTVIIWFDYNIFAPITLETSTVYMVHLYRVPWFLMLISPIFELRKQSETLNKKPA